MKADVFTPADCRGAFSECAKRNPSLTLEKFYRGQMRGFAGHWRRRKIESIFCKQTPASYGGTMLALAKTYRDLAGKAVAP